MTGNTRYQIFIKRWKEVTNIPPQTFGSLTPYYKTIIKYVKDMPWFILIPFSLGMVLILYCIFGGAIALLTTILQRGF